MNVDHPFKDVKGQNHHHFHCHNTEAFALLNLNSQGSQIIHYF